MYKTTLVVVLSLSRFQLFNSMVCSTPGFPVLHHLWELAQTNVHWDSDAIQPSHPLSFPSPPPFPASGSFLMSCLFTSHGQSDGASASASLFPKSSQSWFPLGPIGWSPCCRRGLSTVAGCRGPPGTPSSARESLPQAPLQVLLSSV